MGCIQFFGDVYLKDYKNWKVETSYPYIYNLEYAISGKQKTPAKNKINLTGASNFEQIPVTPIAVNLANNHILDMKDAGVLATIHRLEENGIGYFGVGKKEENYNNPCIIEIEGKKIALLGYGDFTILLEYDKCENRVSFPDNKQIEKDIINCKKQADIVIVNMHWGWEERPCYIKKQTMLAHKLIDLGADLIIGHHPHCIQPIEKYKGKYIFYSLGNFYFEDIKEPSYYDSEGNAEFICSIRQRKHNKQSISVVYDIHNNKLKQIEFWEKKGDKLIRRKEISDEQDFPKFITNQRLSVMIGLFRRMVSLLYSNICFDKKLVNVKAFKKEFEFLGARKTKKEN